MVVFIVFLIFNIKEINIVSVNVYLYFISWMVVKKFFIFFLEGKVVVVFEVVILLKVGWEEFCYEVWGCVILVKEVGLIILL